VRLKFCLRIFKKSFAHTLQIARGAVFLGAKAAKLAVTFAPVDDTVKSLVSAGADLVADQARADPDASVAERIQIGAS